MCALEYVIRFCGHEKSTAVVYIKVEFLRYIGYNLSIEPVRFLT
jgi:hypothetical protein